MISITDFFKVANKFLQEHGIASMNEWRRLSIKWKEVLGIVKKYSILLCDDMQIHILKSVWRPSKTHLLTDFRFWITSSQALPKGLRKILPVAVLCFPDPGVLALLNLLSHALHSQQAVFPQAVRLLQFCPNNSRPGYRLGLWTHQHQPHLPLDVLKLLCVVGPFDKMMKPKDPFSH